MHDAAEDQGGYATLERIRAEFGGPVAAIVEECSDSFGEPKPPWRERKQEYLSNLETASEASLHVSLADKLHNMRTIVVDYREVGEELWTRFNAERDEVLWYYRSLAAAFARRRPGALATELGESVAKLERWSRTRSPEARARRTRGCRGRTSARPRARTAIITAAARAATWTSERRRGTNATRIARPTVSALTAVWSHSREWSWPQTLNGEVRSIWLLTRSVVEGREPRVDRRQRQHHAIAADEGGRERGDRAEPRPRPSRVAAGAPAEAGLAGCEERQRGAGARTWRRPPERA